MDDELSPEQIAELEAALHRLVGELEAQVTATRESGRPVELDQPIGRLSRMDAIQQQQMAAAGRRAAERRLLGVRTALEAIADDAYGLCRRCEEPIAFRRLQARPEAPFCVACQSAVERRG